MSASRTRDDRGVVVPSRLMLVAILVVAVGAAMYVATAPGKKDPAASASSSSTTPSAGPSSPSSTWLSATPTPTSTPSPSAKASSKPSSGPSASASVSAPAQAVRRSATFVEVFNNTQRKGLASRAATRAKGVGWKVVGSDNWYGTIPSSTVYYPAKYARAAKALARDLGITRVEPAVTPMRADRLTVILTADYRAR